MTKIMNQRERFRRIMQFQTVDRVPNYEMGLLKGTAERWHSEGLPSGVDWREYFDMAEDFRFAPHRAGAPNVGMIPPFEEKVIEETDRYIVSIGKEGIKSKNLKTDEEFMPQWLEYPVKNHQDFEKLKQRYDAKTPGRYPVPELWQKKVEAWRKRSYHLRPPADYGAYSTLRKWLGTENLSLAFYDQPRLIQEMVDFLSDFLIEVLQKAVGEVDFDDFYFAEDMAYKGAPLISPKCFRQFLLPFYERVIPFLGMHGIRIFSVDSDGNFDALIPLLLEGGVTGIFPL